MTASIQQRLDTNSSLAEGDLLSGEPEKRIVELQLLERLLTPTRSSSVFHFGGTAIAATKDCAAADFARMTDSGRDAQFASFEQAVPTRADFGPFRGRRELTEVRD